MSADDTTNKLARKMMSNLVPEDEKPAATSYEGRRRHYLEDDGLYDYGAYRTPQVRMTYGPTRSYMPPRSGSSERIRAILSRIPKNLETVEMTRSELTSIVNEMMRATADLMDEAGLLWSTEGAQVMRRALTDMLSTAYCYGANGVAKRIRPMSLPLEDDGE